MFKVRHSFDRCTIAFFCAVLAAPAVDLLVRDDTQRSPVAHEMRTPVPLPPFPLELPRVASFPRDFEAHFADSFGLRDLLIGWNSRLQIVVFGVSPTPRMVLGDERWMFFAGDGELMVHRGLEPFTERELEEWCEVLLAQRAWCRARGIEYLLILGPNKETIYPDLLPAAWNVVGRTRLEQLYEHLRVHTDLVVVDLRPALRAARAEPRPEPLYYPHGTHWCGRGTALTTRAIAERLHALFPAIEPLEESALTRYPIPDNGDSWMHRMYATSLALPNEHWLPTAARRHEVDRTAAAQGARLRNAVDDPRLPRAVILHDSFGASIEPLLSECFSSSTWFWTHAFQPEEIEAERPDVLLMLYVENVLVTEPAHELRVRLAPFRARRADELKAAFEASENVLWRLDTTLDPHLIGTRGSPRIEVEPGEGPGTLLVETQHAGDTLLLAGPSEPQQHAAILRLEVTSPVATSLRIFHLREGDRDYSRRQSSEVALAAGRSCVYVPIEAVDLAGPPMIRPGDEPGSYRFHALELRADPR